MARPPRGGHCGFAITPGTAAAVSSSASRLASTPETAAQPFYDWHLDYPTERAAALKAAALTEQTIRRHEAQLAELRSALAEFRDVAES